MKTQNQSEIVNNMDKQALRAYGILSLVSYSLALVYCYNTGHFLEMGIMGAVMLGLGILIYNIYSSVGVKAKKHEVPNSFNQAA